MKILVVLGEDTFKLDSISSESYRDGSVHYAVLYDRGFLEKIVPKEELLPEPTLGFWFIKGMSFKDGTDYYKISYRNKTFEFKPNEVFFS